MPNVTNLAEEDRLIVEFWKQATLITENRELTLEERIDSFVKLAMASEFSIKQALFIFALFEGLKVNTTPRKVHP